MAGELGHICVETDGFQCSCGQKGCVEQYASGPGISNCSRHIGQETSDTSPFAVLVKKHPERITSQIVYEFVAKNDPVAIKVHHRTCDMLARAVGIMINALSPDRIILGGGVLTAGQIIIDTVKKYAARYCWREIFERCSIVAAKLGENAGVLGAGAMVFQEFTN